jgi:hypothetical protein
VKLVPKRPRWEQGEVRYVPDPDRACEVTLGEGDALFTALMKTAERVRVETGMTPWGVMLSPAEWRAVTTEDAFRDSLKSCGVSPDASPADALTSMLGFSVIIDQRGAP